LQTLADGGLIAFTCLAAFIYLLFTKGVNSIRQRKDPQQRSIAVGSLAGCFGVLIHSFFDFPLRTPANAFFFLMLTTLAIVEIGKGSRREATDQLSVR
jgi:O-antigen ligase